MNTGEAEPSSGLNGRLRPRKSNIPSPNTSKSPRKPDTKPAVDKPKRTSTPSKAFPNKPDDLTDKADSPATQTLCPYCDKTYFTKQSLTNHVRRTHLSAAKQDTALSCLYCNHGEPDAHDIIRHMVDSHPNQYFACYDCHTRFPSTAELAEHKLNVCDKQKLPYRNKLRQKATPKKTQKNINIIGRNDFGNDAKDYPEEHGFNGIVISCELKPSHVHDLIDIEDNITTNFILPPGKNLVNGAVVEKNAVIILDDLQWSKRGPPNFSFQNTDADQILSRLGVVHRSPRTGESTAREWLKNIEDSHQKFEKCFDTSFYSKVASNVQENLTKFLDGSCNFNPDPENTIKTRKAKNIVAINTVEGFPILLACEQFSRHGFDGYMPRAIAPKHKWKWDNLENEKSLMSPEQIKRDSHTNNCIISLVSSLDIWTQLCMRRKYETKYNKSPVQKKTEKQSIIGKELKEILESRELPASTSQVVKYTGPPAPGRSLAEFPASLGLVPTAPSFDLKPAVLSGEWVRPRCYVCCACGAQSRDSKGLSSHISAQHPNAQIQHYEIVGEVLLNSDILKHLYVPPSQVVNRTRPLRGFRECTKCRKSISIEDLHQHILDCAGDTPTVRRKCRPRPFGVRKRRPRLPDNTIRKKMRKDIGSRHSRKNHMRPRPRIRTEVGDAETIRKMLADLPAKRHRVMVKPLNPTIRPRRNLIQTRNKLVMQKRMTEETKKSQRESSSQVPTASAGGDGSQKNSRDRDDRPSGRHFKTTAKRVTRVVSKIIRKNESFNKKCVTKSKKKMVLQKDPKEDAPADVETPPKDSEQNSVQVNQLSIENNSERINMNNGSYNAREHGSRSNNNSNNKDNLSPDPNNGQNSNSRDSFGPSQNVPLKHSIASLTANTETQDKSVQFHHLFLVHQECNNVNQHVPTEQRMLFENEAVVTKLDKPPLHFNHRRQLDLQAYQKNKLNKPRKGLNDCIAMLKNKLVEPGISTMPGHVSVQCGDDEPLDPEPIIVERRHSTTELKTDYMQRAEYVQSHLSNRDLEENVQSSKSRVTRRSSSTRHGSGSRATKAADIVSSNELMQWRQFYYDSQMLTAQNITENYTKRESSRRRNSFVPADDLFLQHAMNLELLSKSKELTKFTEYSPYPSVSTRTNTSKKNNRHKNKVSTYVQSTKSKTKDNVTTRGKNVESTSIQPNKQPKQSNRSKSVINSTPTKRNIDRHNTKSLQSCNTVVPVEKFIEPYSHAVVVEDTSPRLNIEARISLVNMSPEEHRPQVVSSNTPLVEYTSNSDIAPSQYTMHNEAAPSGPLDLTNKIANKEDSVQYIPQEQFPDAAYDTNETLDLSNKNLGTLPVTDTHINSDDVVDMRINYAHASFQPRYTPLPPELVNNEVDEDNATDLSLRRDEDIPTDLSMNRRDYSTSANPYENTTEGHGRVAINYVRDFSNSMRHVGDRCIIVHEYFDENSERIVVVENEVPADFSSIRSLSRSNMCNIEEPVHLNAYRNTAEPNDENVPSDLSGKRRPFMTSSGATIAHTVCNYDNYDTQQASHCLNSDQIIDYHYNRPIRTPSETNFTRSSNRRSISYGEPSQRYETTINTALKACVKQDLSTNDTTVNQSKNFEQIDYSHSDMPLSLVSNLAKESTSCNSSRNSRTIETEYEITVYTVENDGISVTKTEPIYTSATIASNVKTLSINKTTETVTKKMDNIKTCDIELPETYNPPSCSDNRIAESKMLPVNSTLTSKTTCTREIDKRKVETVNVSNSKTANLDQDAETARKIAMLPKELVEILGTMPVDHRNQLLNVLPQYVSTSTSPVSHFNTAETVRCNSGSSSESSKLVNQVAKEFKYEANSEDNRITNTFTSTSKNFKFSESSPISVSSSILLTPPTPQVSERYSIQSQKCNEIQKYNTTMSRASTEDKTPSTSIDSNKLSIGSSTLAVKRLTQTIEHNDSNRVIDLTVDDNSSGKTEVTNLESVIHTNMVTASTKDTTSAAVISKSNVQKTSSDKTASLRAVRIKTPSERHRSMVSENTLISQQNKMTLTINVKDDTIKDPETVSPMAIQKAEVSSTQHRPVVRTPETAMVSPSDEHQKAEEKLIEKKDSVEVPIINSKSNLVTSTLSKDMSSNFNNDRPTVACKESTAKTSVEAINVSFSKGPCIDIDMNDKANTIHKVSTMENMSIDKQSLLIPKDSSLIDDEDSEDDISLAFIVKQKQQKSNLISNAHLNPKIDVQSKLSGNKKKRKPKKINNKSKIVSGDKSLLEDEHEIMKNTVTDIVSENSSINNKESVCNEINLIDKTPHGKNNGGKGQRLNNAQTIEYSDTKDQTNDKNGYENEINKENNVTSDVKSSESLEESFKLKPNDKEPNLCSSVNTTINTDINSKDSPNPLLEIDKSKKMLEIKTTCTNEISEINKVDSETRNPRQNYSNFKLSQNSLNSSSVEQPLSQPQAGIESEIVLGTGVISENMNKTIESKNGDLKLDALSKPDKSKDVSNSEKSTKSKKVSIELCPADNFNSDSEETNVTPLRRSRRGKSLFIDSYSTTAVNPALRYNANEQRAPLPKKQLIFSKLLLDEENHNKISLNATPILVDENLDKSPLTTARKKVEINYNTSLNTHPKLVEENSSKSLIIPIVDEVKNNLVSSITPENPVDQNLETQEKTSANDDSDYVFKDEFSPKKTTNTRTTTTNKRKISPQCKRRPKKKKSFGNQAKPENTNLTLQQNVHTENELNQNIVENKETLPHDNDVVSEIESKNDEVLVKKDTNEVNNDGVRLLTNLDSTDVIPKTLSIEKRKSCSPGRDNSLQSSKSKKIKLDDDNESTKSATSKKETITELKSPENCTITSKNITCYNKPARRVRSKSVVVKSSGADFYDPYDIDLEDMIDKTEKKVISAQMSFSSFKSSIAAKTRKLSKTTTTIIDINTEALVNDNDRVTDGQNNDSIAVHKNTSLDVKNGSSDSDDSSKSDVPLKKYAEEKEKKLAEISLITGRNKKSGDNTDDSSSWRDKTTARKKNNRSISINKKEEKIEDDKIDSEKDLRSEQFMESFGFFSERKPRKSNLLATKKISETFHIIANDSDDVYFTSKDRGSKKGPTDNRKEDTKYLKGSSVSPTKKAAKRGRKKKSITPEQLEPRFCTVCKKAFRRSDNFLRHQMTLYHVSRLCEVELKVKAVIIEEEPNYLIAYKQQLERLKLLQDKIEKRKKHSLPTSDIVLPTLQEILADVKRTIREQELSRRELSRDEALFVDCCEMLKQSHKKDIPPDNKCVRLCNSFNCPQTNDDQLAILEKRLDDKCETKSDEDMDAITAKKILESDEVRNLEYDLITNLKEGNGLKGFGRLRIQSSDELAGNVPEALATTSGDQKSFNFEIIADPVDTKPKNDFNFEMIEDPVATKSKKDFNFEIVESPVAAKPKPHPEVKDKMYPDVYDTIDMFEDKFDKIKRKCRSQAAAAKQVQTQVDPKLSHKTQKKSDRKKGKKTSKKSTNAVPTKGALKGFDGIKVSILTSDINMSAIVPSVGSSSKKKKKKNNSKRKRERKSSDVSSKSDSDHVTKDSSQKKVDVYEFLDTEDTELFEFRPSTLMERFKSISNKEVPSTSKAHANELTHSSSESMSDGDDFVYMDDLRHSEDETENSVLSCEIGCGKGNNDTKKASPVKRKDVIEKNAVMGKIFKHNAVRADKKSTKQLPKPKANLDQLFDSLLENEAKEQSKDKESPKEPTPPPTSFCSLSPKRKESTQSKRDELPPVVLTRKPEPSMSVTPFEELISQRNAQKLESVKQFTQPSRAPKFNPPFGKYRDADKDDGKSKFSEDSPAEDYDDARHKCKEKDKSSSVKEERWGRAAESLEEEVSEDGGVARQRARRKCTVGKQNVLAETWSSESEPDATPARPTSAESVLGAHARRRRAKRAPRPEARGPSARARPPSLGWGAEAEPGHPQQHGWIVGDSHKKLVTMLAHAKGRKRSHDDRRPLIE